MVDNDGYARDGIARAAGSIGLDTIEPRGVGGDVDLGGEIRGSAVWAIQRVEIVERQRVGDAGQRDKVDLRDRVGELAANVRGKVGFARVEVYEWRWGGLEWRQDSESKGILP